LGHRGGKMPAAVRRRQAETLVSGGPTVQTRWMRLRRRPRLAPQDVLRLVALLALFAAVLLVALVTDVFEEITPRRIHETVRHAGVWAPAIYLVGFVLRPITLLPLTFWLVAGGIAFGWTRGVPYAFVGANLGAAATFLAARALGRDFVLRRLGRPTEALRTSGRWGARHVLSLQLFPFMPHDLLNVAAACSRIPYGRFLVGSAIGTLPGIVLYTYAGSVLLAPGSTQFWTAFAALAALSAASLLASRRFLRRGARAVAGEEAFGDDGLEAEAATIFGTRGGE
jgi:uncharacterized membrane protein YdjX (TVP38/TMEM64 family)